MGAGAEWRQRREEIGKTLDEVSAELRISRKYLLGIEEGNYVRLPARVFSSGFIRAYANFLSLDPEPVLTEYYGHLEMLDAAEPHPQTRPEWLERERLRGTRRTAYYMATMAVLAAGIVLAWYSMRSTPVPPPAPEVPQAAPSAASQGVEAAPAADNAAAPAEREESAAGPEQKTVVAVAGSRPVAGPYQLFLEASELTWVMYGRDDAEPVDVMLYPGDRLSIQARKKIYLKIGNAGGVIGTMNGNVMPPFGEKGQVKEIVLEE